MIDDTLLPFSFPAIRGKKITAAFDGGRITSDGGVATIKVRARIIQIVALHASAPFRPTMSAA